LNIESNSATHWNTQNNSHRISNIIFTIIAKNGKNSQSISISRFPTTIQFILREIRIKKRNSRKIQNWIEHKHTINTTFHSFSTVGFMGSKLYKELKQYCKTLYSLNIYKALCIYDDFLFFSYLSVKKERWKRSFNISLIISTWNSKAIGSVKFLVRLIYFFVLYGFLKKKLKYFFIFKNI
jgi:hypothetical protein